MESEQFARKIFSIVNARRFYSPIIIEYGVAAWNLGMVLQGTYSLLAATHCFPSFSRSSYGFFLLFHRFYRLEMEEYLNDWASGEKKKEEKSSIIY